MLVDTEGGAVRGSHSPGACRACFWGIPYAAPPTGSRRWRPPDRADPWDGVRDGQADNFSKCLQLPDGGLFGVSPDGEAAEEVIFNWRRLHDEDCLFVNVQTPRLPSSKNASLLPVLVSIHGGSYLSGSGSGTNASELCADDILYVSFNYRIGIFGALSLPELMHESNTTGNYAIQDQRAALRWTRDNIHLFGGDPRRITLSGESAGAMAVAAHLASPRSAPLFQQAIMMSGNDASLLLDEAYEAGERFAAQTTCPRGPKRLVCLRASDAWHLLNQQNSVYNGTMRALCVPQRHHRIRMGCLKHSVGSCLRQGAIL